MEKEITLFDSVRNNLIHRAAYLLGEPVPLEHRQIKAYFAQ